MVLGKVGLRIAAATVLAGSLGACASHEPDVQACQEYNAWDNALHPKVQTLNAAVADASRGPDGNLTAELDNLQETVQTDGDPTEGYPPPGSQVSMDENNVEDATVPVSQTCMSYGV